MIASLFTSSVLLGSALAGVVPRASVPSDDGFPMPNDQQVMDIAKIAGGKLPGGSLPKELGPGSTTAFQLIAFNELFETAFFSSLLQNVSSGVAGYETDSKDEVEKILKTILAQEELHAVAAGAVLQTAGKFAPRPCEYKFPVDNLKDAVNLAETFTVAVLGALQGANVLLSTDDQQGLVRVVSSVIGQEGEQNGYYRVFLKRVPSESPFLTTVPAAFAWSALQNFIVSCPDDEIKKVDLPIIPGLMVNDGIVALIEPNDQILSFAADVGEDYSGKDLYLTYTTGQQLPISVPVEEPEWDGTKVTFKANFPYNEYAMGGFSHAALTTSNEFEDADAVVKCALAGPGLIQVNY